MATKAPRAPYLDGKTKAALKPWLLTDPPTSRATYFRRQRGAKEMTLIASWIDMPTAKRIAAEELDKARDTLAVLLGHSELDDQWRREIGNAVETIIDIKRRLARGRTIDP